MPGNGRPFIISIPEENEVQVVGGESPADGEDTTDGAAAEVERSTDGADLANEDVARVEMSTEGECLAGEEGSGDEHITNSDGSFLSAEEPRSSSDEALNSEEDATNGEVHRPRREVRPPQRLTYDLIGKPSNRAWIQGVQVFHKCEPWRPWA